MSDEREPWAAVDDYLNGLLAPPDPVLDAALRASADAGLPPISVSPTQGKLLFLLARLVGARRILEVGTLGGYSTIWLARALPPDGSLLSLEVAPQHAEVARANLERAGLSSRAEVRVGRAKETLAELVDEGVKPYDLAFIDADKPGNPDYLRLALRLAHPGTLIVIDNVVRQGEVADPASADPGVQGTRQMFSDLASEAGVVATAVQTVGSKGYDGFALVLVTEVPPSSS